jgi:hypothetical protein
MTPSQLHVFMSSNGSMTRNNEFRNMYNKPAVAYFKNGKPPNSDTQYQTLNTVYYTKLSVCFTFKTMCVLLK